MILAKFHLPVEGNQGSDGEVTYPGSNCSVAEVLTAQGETEHEGPWLPGAEGGLDFMLRANLKVVISGHVRYMQRNGTSQCPVVEHVGIHKQGCRVMRARPGVLLSVA